MPISKRQIALLHVAKAKLGLSDEGYRDCLRNVAGVNTSKDLTPARFELMLHHFKSLGFNQTPHTGRPLGDRPGMATPTQVDYIRTMWRQYAGVMDEKALNRWMDRCFGVSALRFADPDTAGKAIIALKNMTRRKKQHG